MERTVGVGGVGGPGASLGVRFWGRLRTPTHFTLYSQDIDALGHEALPYLLPSRFECEIFEYFLVLPFLTLFTLLCCCCYAMERTSFSGAAWFRAGTRTERSTPRKLGRSSAKAPRKLSSSTAMQLAAGSRSGYPLNFAFTLK